MTQKKWIKKVSRVCEPFGYEVTGLTKSGHLKLTHPTLPTIFTSGTPSDHRVIRNLRKKLRQAAAGNLPHMPN